MITCHENGLGFTVRAEEGRARGTGYEFAAYSETSPYAALGRLRQKIYRGLATRHITGSRGGYNMTHDRLSGRLRYRNWRQRRSGLWAFQSRQTVTYGIHRISQPAHLFLDCL